MMGQYVIHASWPRPCTTWFTSATERGSFRSIDCSAYEFSYKNEHVPCAVCHDIYATSSIMIPGKRVFLAIERNSSCQKHTMATNLGPSICASIKIPSTQIEGSKPNETLPRVGNLWFPPVSPYDILCCLHKLTTLVRKTYFWNEIFYFVMTLLKEYVYY